MEEVLKDIIIKKTGELIEDVAETGMVTGFGYVPTTADKLTKTIKWNYLLGAKKSQKDSYTKRKVIWHF